MNYESSVRYLLSLGRELAAPTQAAAAKFDLENITILAERLGRPDRAYPSVHIAGTNGKGSTAAFLESILRHAGFRTGLNTSPHLEKINERIRINGQEINDEAFAETFTRIQLLIEELLAAAKLLSPVVSIITRLDFDHENFLGHSLKEIAAEKAGILKPGVPLILAEQPAEARELILARATELGSPVIEPAQVFHADREPMEEGRIRARIRETDS